MPTLAVNGDLFEQGYEAWIGANLPDYERIWTEKSRRSFLADFSCFEGVKGTGRK